MFIVGCGAIVAIVLCALGWTRTSPTMTFFGGMVMGLTFLFAYVVYNWTRINRSRLETQEERPRKDRDESDSRGTSSRGGWPDR